MQESFEETILQEATVNHAKGDNGTMGQEGIGIDNLKVKNKEKRKKVKEDISLENKMQIRKIS